MEAKERLKREAIRTDDIEAARPTAVCSWGEQVGRRRELGKLRSADGARESRLEGQPRPGKIEETG